MTLCHLIRCLALSGAIVWAAIPSARAAPETIDLTKLQTLAVGLGLTDSSDKTAYVQVDNQGSENYTVYLAPTNDKTTALVYTYLAKVPADRSTVPLAEMLEFNDGHDANFTINEQYQGLYLQSRIPAVAVTPQSLRATIDDLLGAADASKTLWQAANGSDAIKSADFKVENVMFLGQKAQYIGDNQKRASNVFAPNDKLITYFEPVGLSYKKAGDAYQFGFSADLELRTPGGKILDGQKGIANETFKSLKKLTEIMGQITLSLDNFAPGDYIVAYTVHDAGSDRTAVIEQPFTVKEAAAR